MNEKNEIAEDPLLGPILEQENIEETSFHDDDLDFRPYSEEDFHPLQQNQTLHEQGSTFISD